MQSEFVSYHESSKEKNIFLLKRAQKELSRHFFSFCGMFYNAVNISDCTASNGNDW
jgi:hypothetical protein